LANLSFLLNSGDLILLNDGSRILMNEQGPPHPSAGAGLYAKLRRTIYRDQDQLTIQDYSKLITSKPYLLRDFVKNIISLPKFVKNINVLSARITSVPIALTHLLRQAIRIESSDEFAFIEPASNWNRSGLSDPEREKTFEQPSSFVGAVIYSAESQTMTIELNGKTYGFCRVSERVYDSFKGSPSKGAHFSRFIKGKFDC